MVGRIIEYDSKGEGSIQGEDENIYTLSISNWRDYSHQPEKDMEVKFIPDTKHNLAIQVKCVSVAQKEEEKDKEKNREDKKRKIEEFEDQKLKLDTLRKNMDDENKTTIQAKYSQSMIDSIKYIPITRSYQSVFSSFFEDALRISENHKLDKSENQLSYPLMRRFMITTYEHLVDKDPQFVRDDLLSLKRNLENLFLIYSDLNSKLSNPAVQIEHIFLQEQEVYSNVMTKIDKNEQRISRLGSVIDDMEKIIQDKLEKLKKSKKNTPEYNDIDTSIKKTRTRYADSVDELDKLNKQTEYLKKISKDFSSSHKIDFLEYFKENSLELISTITNMMNSNAYKFDKYMWDCAKKSKAIKKFFIESSIEGSFSSRTFLRYFLNTLDMSKASMDKKDLKQLLDYLDSQDRKSILVIDDQSYMLPNIKYFLNHIDNFYRATSIPPTDAKLKISSIKADFVIVNANINALNVLEFVKNINYIHKDKAPEVILIGEKFKVDFVLEAKKLKINHFVSVKLNELQLFDALAKLILDKDEQEIVKSKEKK
jgi:hypothetical protein